MNYTKDGSVYLSRNIFYCLRQVLGTLAGIKEAYFVFSYEVVTSYLIIPVCLWPVFIFIYQSTEQFQLLNKGGVLIFQLFSTETVEKLHLKIIV